MIKADDETDGMQDPLAIYQAQIDAVSRSFWRRDWTQLMTLLALPTQLRTHDARITLHDHDETLAMMQELRDDLERMNVTEYHRIATKADYTDRDAGIIAGSHVTHLMRGGSHARAPYACRQFIRIEDGLWKCYDLDCAVHNRDLAVIGPETAKARRALPASESGADLIYQDWLDRCDAAFWVEDHAKLGAMMAYPHRFRAMDGACHFDTAADLIAAARDFRAHLRRTGVGQFYRVCTGATFVADGTAIEGGHMTHIRTELGYLHAPYPAKMTLVLRNGRWLCGQLEAEARNADLVLFDQRHAQIDTADNRPTGG